MVDDHWARVVVHRQQVGRVRGIEQCWDSDSHVGVCFEERCWQLQRPQACLDGYRLLESGDDHGLLLSVGMTEVSGGLCSQAASVA